MSWLPLLLILALPVGCIVVMMLQLYSVDHAVDRIEKLLKEQYELLRTWHAAWQERKP